MPAEIKIRQNDTRPIVQAQLLKGHNQPIDLAIASEVRFKVLNPNKSVVMDKTATISNENEGRVEYHWESGDTDTAGDFRAYFEVTFNDGTVVTIPNESSMKMRVYPDA